MLVNIFFPTKVTENFNTQEVIDVSHPAAGETQYYIDERLFNIAQFIRTRIGGPVRISSAYRNADYNATVEGSAKNSQHIHGNAFDLQGEGVVEFVTRAYNTKNSDWYHMVTLGLNGLGLYDNFVHIDTRQGGFAFWSKQKKNIISGVVAVVVFVGFLLSSMFKN